MVRYAKLEGKKIVPISNVLEWAEWFETSEERFLFTDHVDDVQISTIFLGVGHTNSMESFTNPDLQDWFETMIFGGEHDRHQERYKTWEEAEAGHKRAVAMVKGQL